MCTYEVAAYPRIFLGGLKQTTESLSQNHQCSDRDLKMKPSKYNPGTLVRLYS